MFEKIKRIIALGKQHKFWSAIIIIAVVVVAYYGYQSAFGGKTVTQYVLAGAQKGTLSSTISGSGQISASNQVDVKAKASGTVLYVNVKAGQAVKAGTLLASIDATDALKAVRDAETALETAKLSMQKLQAPATELTMLQAENSLTQAKNSLASAKDNLSNAYDSGFNDVTGTFLDLPGVMTGLQSILLGNDFNTGQVNQNYYLDAARAIDDGALQYEQAAANSYNTARIAYDENFNDYKVASHYSDTATIEKLIKETYDTSVKIAQAVKDANNFIQFYKDKLTERGLRPATLADTHLTSLSSYTSKANSHISALLSDEQTIETDKLAITNAEISIKEKTLSLADLKAGADSLDLRAAQITINQKEDTLLDAKINLSDCYPAAPFDGIIASVTIKKGDSASSGSTVATIITQQQIAEITVNELDAAKIKVGQKATLSFDALPDLSLTGSVSQVDTIGTVSQGVVSYTVQISLDTQNSGIKPGMTVSVNIITAVKTDVILVPNSAVKSSGNTNYVLVPADSTGVSTGTITLPQTPIRKTVTIGIADDTNTEIISGLNENDLVVTNTITGTATVKPATTGGSSIRIPGVGGGFGR
ncbi:MAG: efflux RND transporter periplasmic adaptor subunit [Parcubacteria group bacterium]